MAKPFESILAAQMEAFLRFKQNLGKPYVGGATVLRGFDRYVAQFHRGRGPLDWPGLIHGWLSQLPGRKAGTVKCNVSAIRQFCLFRRRYDPTGFVPDHQWAPKMNHARFLPETLSRSQVAQLIKRTGKLKDLPLRRSGLRSLICTLYSTGLRLGEALRLRLADVHLKERCFFIRMSKGRSRWVPFREDLRKELKEYVDERRQWVGDGPESFLFCRADGGAYSVHTASWSIRKLMREAGFKPARGRFGPRAHDLRHGFARERLRRWYRSGANVQRRLLDLSVYLGHLNLLGTEIYLKATPDLLATASRRMARRLGKLSR